MQKKSQEEGPFSSVVTMSIAMSSQYCTVTAELSDHITEKMLRTFRRGRHFFYSAQVASRILLIKLDRLFSFLGCGVLDRARTKLSSANFLYSPRLVQAVANALAVVEGSSEALPHFSASLLDAGLSAQGSPNSVYVFPLLMRLSDRPS